MSEKIHIPIAKHLEDQDNLLENRDAGLVPGQEQRASDMAESIYDHAISNEFKILLFCISPKERAIETAELVKKNLANKENRLPVISEVDANLREIDQGKFILPDDYKEGDHFPGLKIAGKIFGSETFNPNNPAEDNLDYHFGDPLPQTDGTDKYPELRQYFSESGESYKDVLLRFYSEVIKLSENLERFKDKVEPVIFTHGQPHQIFTDLSEVAEKIDTEGFSFEPGELPRICWNIYQSRRRDVIPFGQIAFVSIERLCKPEIIERLKKEISYLEKYESKDL